MWHKKEFRKHWSRSDFFNISLGRCCQILHSLLLLSAVILISDQASLKTNMYQRYLRSCVGSLLDFLTVSTLMCCSFFKAWRFFFCPPIFWGRSAHLEMPNLLVPKYHFLPFALFFGIFCRFKQRNVSKLCFLICTDFFAKDRSTRWFIGQC